MNKFRKIMNVICLAIWIFELVLGIVAVCIGNTINPIVFICATSVCILHYACEIMSDT